jgi:hypothetical protein
MSSPRFRRQSAENLDCTKFDFRMRSKWEDYRNKNLTHPAGRLLFDSNSRPPWRTIRLNAYYTSGQAVLGTTL